MCDLGFRPDFRAHLYAKTPEEGGRKSGIFSGYRPNIRVGGELWDCVLHTQGEEVINPGTTATVYLTFHWPRLMREYLAEGSELAIREGPVLVVAVATLLEDLWKGMPNQLKAGQTFQGLVDRVHMTEASVKIGDCLWGRLKSKELGLPAGAEIHGEIQVGQQVAVAVADIDWEHNDIFLRLVDDVHSR